MSERTIAGRYTLVEPLAREGDWLAEDTELGRRVTLRLLDPEGEPFETSARAAASLAHPHIGRLYDYGESDGAPFVVAEHLPGGSLESRLTTGGPLSADEADRVARDVAGALAYAHAQGVAHGDLGPGSVQFDAEGRAKVTDFGTTSGGSPAADVGAFGALGFLLLTGRDPDDPASLERLRPDAPPALVAAVLAALGAGASPRPADGPALLELLGAPAPAAPPPPSEPQTEILAPVTATPSERRRVSAAVAVTLALLALLGAGIAAAMLAGGDGDDDGAPLPSLSLPSVSTGSTATTATTEGDEAPTTSAPETTTEATTSTAAATTRPVTTQAPSPPATTQAPPPTTEAPPPPPPPTEEPTTVPTEETTTAETTTPVTTAP